VELAGAIGELAHWTFRDNFRAIDPARARILVVEGNDRVLPAYPPDLSAKAVRSLERLGAEVMTSATVVDVRPDGVTVRRADRHREAGAPVDLARDERIAARTVLWSAGVAASPLGKRIAEACGASTDKAGRVPVQPDLTIPGHPEVFVVGDLATVRGADGQLLPGVAQVAIQGGRYAARLISARVEGRTLPPFRYNDLGLMATIGRAAAVAVIRGRHLWGYPAWLVWLFIHLTWLVQFESKLLVLTQWAWNYITRNRSARLITGGPGDGESRRDHPRDHALVNPSGPAPGMLLLLRETAIRTLFDPRAGLEAIERAFAAYSTARRTCRRSSSSTSPKRRRRSTSRRVIFSARRSGP
jgi:NADH dehydrogenase